MEDLVPNGYPGKKNLAFQIISKDRSEQRKLGWIKNTSCAQTMSKKCRPTSKTKKPPSLASAVVFGKRAVKKNQNKTHFVKVCRRIKCISFPLVLHTSSKLTGLKQHIYSAQESALWAEPGRISSSVSLAMARAASWGPSIPFWGPSGGCQIGPCCPLWLRWG